LVSSEASRFRRRNRVRWSRFGRRFRNGIWRRRCGWLRSRRRLRYWHWLSSLAKLSIRIDRGRRDHGRWDWCPTAMRAAHCSMPYTLPPPHQSERERAMMAERVRSPLGNLIRRIYGSALLCLNTLELPLHLYHVSASTASQLLTLTGHGSPRSTPRPKRRSSPTLSPVWTHRFHATARLQKSNIRLARGQAAAVEAV
jgi:hypothetical protein